MTCETSTVLPFKNPYAESIRTFRLYCLGPPLKLEMNCINTLFIFSVKSDINVDSIADYHDQLNDLVELKRFLSSDKGIQICRSYYDVEEVDISDVISDLYKIFCNAFHEDVIPRSRVPAPSDEINRPRPVKSPVLEIGLNEFELFQSKSLQSASLEVELGKFELSSIKEESERKESGADLEVEMQADTKLGCQY